MVRIAFPITLAVGLFVLAARTSSQSTQSTVPPQSPFPEGKGREALFKVCGGCHGPESVLGQLKTREEWSKTLDEMAGYGAEGSDSEYRDIQEYLVKGFSLILVNKAAAKELETTLDVTPNVAEAVVQYREQHGRVASIDELKKIPGIDAAKIDARKDRLVF